MQHSNSYLKRLDNFPLSDFVQVISLIHYFLILQAPKPALSQFPVTNYNLTCTPSEGDSCTETLPANTTSYDLTVVAGVQYTITVSALSNGRESRNSPQRMFGMCSALCLWQVKVSSSFLFSTI